MKFITHVRLSSGGSKHEHITDVKWLNSSDNTTGTSTKQAMVDYLEKGNKAYVKDGSGKVEVLVVDATPKPKYLRTKADDRWTDNLLSLPRF